MTQRINALQCTSSENAAIKNRSIQNFRVEKEETSYMTVCD